MKKGKFVFIVMVLLISNFFLIASARDEGSNDYSKMQKSISSVQSTPLRIPIPRIVLRRGFTLRDIPIKINVSSCTTLDIPNSIYIQTNNIMADKSPCIKITAPNILFDGQGYAISNNSFRGIGIYSNQENTKIKNIRTYLCGWKTNGIYINQTSGTEIDNALLRCSENGLSFNAVANSKINNLKVPTSTGTGIGMYSSNNNILTNLETYNNFYNGIVLSGSSNNIVKNVISSNNSMVYSVSLLSGSNNNFLQNITASDSKMGFAFFLSSSHRNTFKDITSKYNWYGFYLSDSRDNTFENVLTRNWVVGFRIGERSNNNIIKNSNISEGDYGRQPFGLVSYSINNRAINVTHNASKNYIGQNCSLIFE